VITGFYELNVFLYFQAEDGKLMADPETGEFWGFFGGFAPLPRKTASDNDKSADSRSPKLLRYDVISVSPLVCLFLVALPMYSILSQLKMK
jgi:hypothetical protein